MSTLTSSEELITRICASAKEEEGVAHILWAAENSGIINREKSIKLGEKFGIDFPHYFWPEFIENKTELNFEEVCRLRDLGREFSDSIKHLYDSPDTVEESRMLYEMATEILEKTNQLVRRK